MSFFFIETKKSDKPKAKKAVRRADIPIASLQTLGCSVCPRDKDEAIRSPKLRPSGPRSPSVYLLGGSPSAEEDEDDNHWTDKAGQVIYDKFGADYMERHVRSNFVTQCRGEQTPVEIECCRNRIVADIEEAKPLVIVTIGDIPLQWVTRLDGNQGSALNHRGTYFVAKVGTHVCWCYCIMYPNFAFKKNYRKSEYELALEHDVRRLKADIEAGLPVPKIYDRGFSDGIEVITGDEPGDMQRLEKALQKVAAMRRSAIDVETNCLRPLLIDVASKGPALMLTCAVGCFDYVVAFAVDHPEGWGSEAQRLRVRSMLLEFLLNSGRKTAHHLGMEMEWFAFYFGQRILRLTEWDDTMALCHTLDERQGTKSLELQVLKAFGFNIKKMANIDTKRILEYPLKDVLLYNGRDSKWTDKLRDYLMPTVMANPKYQAEYERKVRLAPTLVQLQEPGLEVDFDFAAKIKRELEDSLTAIEGKLKRTSEVREYEQRNGSFSATNDQHVLKLMRDICQRDEVRVEDPRTKVVRWTTDEDALSKIPKEEAPSAALVLEHRGTAKLLSTYVLPVMAGHSQYRDKPLLNREGKMIKSIVCPDGRVRAQYGSMVTVTGRLNSEDPNIQNWPARKHKRIRAMIRAARRRWLVAFDYGQIEFRVVGMASGDPEIVMACWTGYDVHGFWAQRMVDLYPRIKDYIVEAFEVDWDEKGLKTLRQEAKNGWVFPQFFGSSVASCAEQLHLPDDVAEDLAAEFWDTFKATKTWQDKLLKSYEKNLYVETLGGRQRRGPMTRHEIINHPIQGTAFDIVAEGMNECAEMSELVEDPELSPNLNVHDDLTFEMDDASLETKIPVIAKEMCRPRFDYINVPLIVEVKAGPNWFDLSELKVYKSNEIFNTPNPYA